VNKIPPYSVAVGHIKLSVHHPTVFSEMKLFAVLWFLVCPLSDQRSKKLNHLVHFCKKLVSVRACNSLVQTLFLNITWQHQLFRSTSQSCSWIFVQTKCTGEYKERSTGISNIGMKVMTSVVICLCCRKIADLEVLI